MDEEWRPVVGYEELYSVSSIGQVRSEVKRKKSFPGKILQTRTRANKGYPMVILWDASKSYRNHSVHSLVAAAFIGPRPPGFEINHVDGVRGNPRVENLEYCTKSENHVHSRSTLGSLVGSKNGFSKLTESSVAMIRSRSRHGEKASSLACEYGVHTATVNRVIARRIWRHV